MNAGPATRRRALIGAIALAVGGLPALVTGLVGVHQMLTLGHILNKVGGTTTGPVAWIACGVFILAGLGMLVLARWQYRRSLRLAAAAADSEDRERLG